MGKVKILSENAEPFRNREEAGRLLGEGLRKIGEKGTAVLGIPRGGVVVAREVSLVLKASLDIALSHKLGAPYNPELAIGAISENGKIFLDSSIASHVDAQKAYIKEEAERQAQEIKRRSALFRAILPKTQLKGRIVIIVDDGLATGATMQASLAVARQEKPLRLIAAVPVASREAVGRVSGYSDEVVCLRLPDFFAAVGEFYVKFNQTTDEEVIEILKEEARKREK